MLADGPIAYWRLGEPAGAIVAASEGSGPALQIHDATLGQPGAIDGDPDTALLLDNDHGLEGNDEDVYRFDGTAAFSLEAWINPAEDRHRLSYVFVKLSAETTTTGYSLTYGEETRGELAFERVVAGTPITVESGGVILDMWHHVVATYSGAVMTIFVDGAVGSTQGDSRAIATEGATLSVGRKGDGFGFRGGIDEVAIYDKALTADQVANHWRVGAHR